VYEKAEEFWAEKKDEARVACIAKYLSGLLPCISVSCVGAAVETYHCNRIPGM
jgi:hypothetical protein